MYLLIQPYSNCSTSLKVSASVGLGGRRPGPLATWINAPRQKRALPLKNIVTERTTFQELIISIIKKLWYFFSLFFKIFIFFMIGSAWALQLQTRGATGLLRRIQRTLYCNNLDVCCRCVCLSDRLNVFFLFFSR